MNDFKETDKLNTDVDVDDIAGGDLKINPDYYIHNAMLKAQNCLMQDNVKEGVLKFFILVEHIETLCKSAKMIPNDYEEQIKKFNEVTKKHENPIVQMSRISNYKLQILTKEFFTMKTATEPLKM